MTDLPRCFSGTDVNADVVACIRLRLTSCPYGPQFNDVTWQFQRGQLTLRGAVKSFYMKQMLQTILRDLQHVSRIENEVRVVAKDPVS